MTRKNLRGIREKSLLKNDKNKSIVAEEISLEEAKKNLIRADFTFHESKTAQQMHSTLIIRDEDFSGPWYFIHI
jgi:hypothetical protein